MLIRADKNTGMSYIIYKHEKVEVISGQGDNIDNNMIYELLFLL